jgi:hypothetical protein
LKTYKSPGSDQIPTELIQAGGEQLLSAIHKLINSVSNKEELPDQWKESIIVPVHKNCDKTYFNNYRGISLHSRLVPYMDEIIGDRQCGFRRNRSITDKIFCIRQILENKWEYNETMDHIHGLQESL